MSTWSAVIPSSRKALARKDTEELLHRMRVWLATFAAIGVTIALCIYGMDYYPLDLDQRVESPLHRMLRPSGIIGLNLGILSVVLFLIIFLYPLRKRWRWLGSIGKTKHWLDYHSIIGITAPILITFHSSFKFAGLAGWAYWIMVIVALSGFIGRYIYTLIPRSLHATELSASELNDQSAALANELTSQDAFAPEQLAALLDAPSSQDVRRMPLLTVLWMLLALDFKRPFLVSRLRRQILTGSERLTTLGGALRSRHMQLESIIDKARQQSRLRSKIAFLDRARQLFHLWHVIHRPFSISFAALVVIHIGVVIMLGYF